MLLIIHLKSKAVAFEKKKHNCIGSALVSIKESLDVQLAGL